MSAGLISPCPWALVMVQWADAFDSENGWVQLGSYKPSPCDVVSVGYVCPDILSGHLSITASYFPGELPKIETVGMITHIPIAMIRRVIALEQPQIEGEKK